jgi:hypothetical protein
LTKSIFRAIFRRVGSVPSRFARDANVDEWVEQQRRYVAVWRSGAEAQQ